MNIRTCIKFPLLWLFFFTTICADTTIIPFDSNKSNDDFLIDPDKRTVVIQETSFLDFTWVLVKTLLVVAAFIGILYGTILLFRRLTEQRFNNRSQGEDIKILERAVISSKSAIYLLEVKNKYFLIGESSEGLRELGSFYNE